MQGLVPDGNASPTGVAGAAPRRGAASAALSVHARVSRRCAHAPFATTELRRHALDDSLFLGDDYLIKGVAGAILWKLASDLSQSGRTDFSNREPRLDPAIGLPDADENLEARLILLRRRQEERGACLRIEKTGRGRFRLVAQRPLQLHEVAA